MSTVGVDIASVDGNGTPNWSVALMRGLCFVGLRAVQGITPDPWYPTYRRQLDALGIPNFPYLIMVPNLYTPEAQARTAVTVVGTLNTNYFPLAIDVEGRRRGLTAEQWLDWVTRAYRVIRTALGVPPLLYTSRSYWVDPDGMDNQHAPELADCLGWWKYWPYPVRTQAVIEPAAVNALASPAVPPPWGNAWGLHQYQGDAIGYPGFRATVDINRVHVMKQGDYGDSVEWIQKRLPNVIVNGDFDPETADAVKTFQTNRKITADGIVGLDTMQLLAWVPPRAVTP